VRRAAPEALGRYIINGRFGTQRTTGVQRVAQGFLHALDANTALPGAWSLLSPPGVSWPPMSRISLACGPFPLGRGHLWEQTVVAAAAGRGACVLNLAGSGPWLGGRQVSWLHDAAVFDHPQAYRPAFARWYRALFRRRAWRGDVLITPSEHARRRLALHLDVPQARLHVLGHGADHLDRVATDATLLQRLGLQPGRYWLCVASHNPTKNLARLLQAHARAGDRWPLVLVGAAHPPVFTVASELAYNADIRRLERATDTELKTLMTQARALLIPSLEEGFGLPAVEAMRAGCAVLAGRAGALPEVCGDAALYVDPLSEASIAEGLSCLARDDALVEGLRIAGTRHTAACTWKGAAQNLLELLRSEALA
jgi:glycosyltransferase involved in cell wall biosynthesis